MLYQQCNDAIIKFPELQISVRKDHFRLSGNFTLNAEYDNIWLIHQYDLSLKIPFKFPAQLPIVTVNNIDVPWGYSHISSQGQLCLGIEDEIRHRLLNEPTICFFIDTIVIENLYSIAYFSQYGQYPFGERAHETTGIVQYYNDRWGSISKKDALRINLYLKHNIYRGHALCPCLSGKKIRNCHKTIIYELSSEIEDAKNYGK